MGIHLRGLCFFVVISCAPMVSGSSGLGYFSPSPVSSSSFLDRRGYFDVKGADFFEKTKTIFVGKLLAKESFRSEDGRFIFTRHLFAVQETIKGDPQERVQIIEYGGTLNGMTMRVSHGPRYLVGQEYLIFSYLDLLQHNRTLAGPLRQFRVVRDRQNRGVIRVYSSHPLLQVLHGGKAGIFQDLTTFSSRLRQAVQGLPDEKK